jgi:hypothetical protein
MLADRMDAARSRRLSAAARLLLSDKPGEVAGAVSAIGRLLPDGLTVPDLIERAVSMPLAPPPSVAINPRHFSVVSWKQRTRMALTCPNLTEWERGFLSDMAQLSTLTARQESCLKRLLAKIEGTSR